MHRTVILIILMSGIVLTLGGAIAKTVLYPAPVPQAVAGQAPGSAGSVTAQ